MKRHAGAAIVAVIAGTLAGCGTSPQETEQPEPIIASAPPVEIRVIEPAMELPPAPPPAPLPAAVEPPVSAEVAAAPAEEWREAFPHVHVNAKTKRVRFDGVVPIDAHDAKAPWVFLEVVVCTPDTKEHEAIVMTQARASHVHAALLLVGLQPGSPGKWTFENGELRAVPPVGDEVSVTLSFRGPDGVERTLNPQEMVVNAHTGAKFGAARAGKWVFAGSQLISRENQTVYDADGAGTLVGLTTFGSETIAWSEIISPDAAVEEPAWIADAKTTPPVGTSVTVTIGPRE